MWKEITEKLWNHCEKIEITIDAALYAVKLDKIPVTSSGKNSSVLYKVKSVTSQGSDLVLLIKKVFPFEVSFVVISLHFGVLVR